MDKFLIKQVDSVYLQYHLLQLHHLHHPHHLHHLLLQFVSSPIAINVLMIPTVNNALLATISGFTLILILLSVLKNVLQVVSQINLNINVFPKFVHPGALLVIKVNAQPANKVTIY
jgi:hypothetical protein